MKRGGRNEARWLWIASEGGRRGESLLSWPPDSTNTNTLRCLDSCSPSSHLLLGLCIDDECFGVGALTELFSCPEEESAVFCCDAGLLELAGFDGEDVVPLVADGRSEGRVGGEIATWARDRAEECGRVGDGAFYR